MPNNQSSWHAGYAANRAFADKFQPQIKEILGAALIETASQEIDEKYATDLVSPYRRISVRVRRSKTIDKFGDKFTLRASSTRVNGKTKYPSEYAKLLQVRKEIPSHIAYFWVNLEETEIIRAWLIDITLWRRALLRRQIKPLFFSGGYGNKVVSFPCDSAYSQLLLSR